MNKSTVSFFNNGKFPGKAETLQAAAILLNNDVEKPKPFQHLTQPYVGLSTNEYGKRIAAWQANVIAEDEPPNQKQKKILDDVIKRVLIEFAMLKEGDDDVPGYVRDLVGDQYQEEPMRGLVHRFPGTGKSRVIIWIRRFFEEALGWKHGEQFLCVASQNRMASSIGGQTLHQAGNFRPGQGGTILLTNWWVLYICFSKIFVLQGRII